MPAVPITQIPNAPNLVPNMGDIPAMGMPSGGGYATPTVRGPDFSNASRMIGSAAELLQAPIPEPFFRTAEFVDRMWGSVANLGERGMAIASMMGDYAMNLQKVQDEGAIAKAGNMVDERYSEFADKMSSRPASEWMPEWNDKVVPKLVKEIGALPISNNGKAKMQVAIDGQLMKHTINTRLRADKQMMQETDDALVAQRDQLEYQGNWEAAAAIDARRNHLGLITKGQLQQSEVERMKKMDAQAIQNFVNTDSFEAKSHFAEAMGKGKSDLFPNMSPQQLTSAFEASNAQVRTIQREGREAIDNMIIREPVNTTPEQIRSIAESIRLPETEIQQMVQNRGVMYQATPQGRGEFLQAQRELYSKMANYDPATDLDEEQYRQLRQEVKSKMPAGEWEIFFDTLSERRKKGRTVRDDIQSDLADLTGNLRKWGILGDDGGTDEKTGKPKNWEKYNAVETKASEVRTFIDDLLKKDPNITPVEARRQFLEHINGKTNGAAGEFYKKKEFDLFSPSTWMSQAQTRTGAMFAGLSGVASQVARNIQTAAERTGTDPRLASVIAYMESGFNPNTKSSTSTARGVFQFLDGDRKRYGGNGIEQGLAKVRENQDAARKALGREPTPAETYVVYFQGTGIGPRILQNPDADFRETLNTVKKGWANTVIKANPFLEGIKTNADLLRWAEQRVATTERKLGLI